MMVVVVFSVMLNAAMGLRPLFFVELVIVAIVFVIAAPVSLLEGARVVAYGRQSMSIDKLEITQ